MYLKDYQNIYVHKQNIIFPDVDNEHIVKSKPKYSFVYDEKFPYRKTDKKTLFKRFWLRFLILTLVNLITRIRYALKIKGKKNIRLYKKMSSTKGILSVCNHTTEWDFLMISIALGHVPEFPMWREGAESTLGGLMRNIGGIVIPRGNIQGLVISFESLKNVLKEEKFLHIFPEAACWSFYPAVRNFELGAFELSYEFKKPILPMGVKYREAKGIYKIFKKHPNAQLSIGEPLLCNYSLTKEESIKDLRDRARLSIMNLIGINSFEENERIRQLIYDLQSNQN